MIRSIFKMSFLAVIVMSILSVFISCKPPEIQYVTIKVPVSVPGQEPPILIWPDLPTRHLTKTSTDVETAKAYAATVWLLIGRLSEAYAIINGYRTTTVKTQISGVSK